MCGVAHYAAAGVSARGSMKLASAPPPALVTRLSLPPCAIRILEQIERPRPRAVRLRGEERLKQLGLIRRINPGTVVRYIYLHVAVFDMRVLTMI